MTEEQPTWGAVAAKTWGDIAGVPPRDGDEPNEPDPYVQEIGEKLDAQQAEIETLKARVAELEARILPLRAIGEDLKQRTFTRRGDAHR